MQIDHILSQALTADMSYSSSTGLYFILLNLMKIYPGENGSGMARNILMLSILIPNTHTLSKIGLCSLLTSRAVDCKHCL